MSIVLFFPSDDIVDAEGIDVLISGIGVAPIDGSLSWNTALNSRDTFAIKVRAHYTTPAPVAVGSRIVLAEDGLLMFGGIVSEVAIEQDGDSEFLVYDIQAQDYSAIPQRRLVAASYEQMTVGAIVADIRTNFLFGEGITLGDVEDGPTIVKAVFNYLYVDQAFNELSELSGMTWWIDPFKRLHVRARSSVLAPAAIGNTTHVTMRVSSSVDQYRNAQTVRAGTDLTDPRTESFIGDGTRRVFNLAFAAGTEPIITINGLAQIVGILGVESDKDWYWNKGKTEIAQSDTGTVLGTADVLAVTYQGQVPLIVGAEDDNEIATRANLDGGSGRYEHVEDRPNIDAGDLALETADQLLARFGRVTRVIDATTRTSGFRAGQLVTITNAKLGLNDQFLIESVSASEWTEPDADGEPHLMFSVRALEGDFQGGWVAFFQKLAEMGRDYVIRENEVLVLLRRRVDGAEIADVLDTQNVSVESRVGFAECGYSEVA